jgi:hypothetical protein
MSSAHTPVIRLVVVIDVAEKDAALTSMNDKPNIRRYPHGPEVLIPRLIELMKTHAGIGRINLQVKRRRFD